MSTEVPDDRYYTKNHEWGKVEGDIVIVGITEYAVEQMNREIISVDLPEVGAETTQEESFGVIDSVKAAFDLFAPVSGEITEVNTALIDNPEPIANSPYQDGWMIKIKPSRLEEEKGNLLTATQYKELIEE